MADDAKPSAGKDIAKPDTTPAIATSKPVIVGHTSQVADPMVSKAVNVEETALPDKAPADVPAAPVTEISTGSSKPKLMPSAEMQEAHAEAEKVEDVQEDTEASDAKVAEEHQAHLQEIIESGQYRVSIGKKAAKINITTFLVTVFVIVLFGVVILYVLADLKILDLGLKLPFHIFKQ